MTAGGVPLPSRLAVGDLAARSILAVCAAARSPHIDPRALAPTRVAAAYRSDRFLRIDGAAPDVWSPLSGFWAAGDGWIRTHANYPHHAAALRAALSLSDDSDAERFAALVQERPVREITDAVSARGGLAVPVRFEATATDAALRRTPLVEVRDLGPAAPRRAPAPASLTGIRVLDLTRVIAGPVCTRTLALLGADVLRIDPPHLPEPAWQHLDTGHGKRSAILDARSDRFADLLAAADVIVLGYRPRALERLGLDADSLAARHPGLVIAQLSAWGHTAPDRRGFDSLVQAESGIAWIESPDGLRPGALPAQALDHSAGYLLAAGILDALHDRAAHGGTRHVRTSLRRVAAELLGMPRSLVPSGRLLGEQDVETQSFEVDGRVVVTTRSAIPGLEYAAPRPWGRDDPSW